MLNYYSINGIFRIGTGLLWFAWFGLCWLRLGATDLAVSA